MLTWLNKHRSELTWQFFIGVVVRVAFLFVGFNVFYLVIQPLNQPHLTLYNHLFLGRLRFAWTDEKQAIVVNEVLLSRLLSDHQIARPKMPDEYRMIVAGSSDVWGRLNTPQEAMPTVLDRLKLVNPHGKIVYVYNTAFVFADIFKDLLITQALIDRGYAPDMILLTVNTHSFEPGAKIHPLVEANPDFSLALAARYRLLHLPLEEIQVSVMTSPAWWRNSFLAQRTDVATWLNNQFMGVTWAVLQTDYLKPAIIPIRNRAASEVKWKNLRPGVLEAFAELSDTYDIPVWLVAVPMNEISQDYLVFLEERAAALNMPLLDCSRLLPYFEFTDTNLHYTAAGHQLFAEKVAGWLQTQWQVSNSASERVSNCD